MKILIVSAGIFHPPLIARYLLERYLYSLPGFSFYKVTSLESLPDLDLTEFHGMALYFHQATLSSPALEAFERFVSSGGGVLAIHSATASFKDTPRYFDILGGRFTSHGPVGPIEIKPSPTRGAAFRAIAAFRVTDELYLHELYGNLQIQFYTEYNGEHTPMVWTRRYGAGRVCYACPGHRSSSLRNPQYLQILARALEWICRTSQEV